MEQVDAVAACSQGQRHLFPKGIGGTVEFYHVESGRRLQAAVGSGFDKDKQLVSGLHLLQPLEFLEHHIVHAVLALTEDTLRLNAYFHDCWV